MLSREGWRFAEQILPDLDSAAQEKNGIREQCPYMEIVPYLPNRCPMNDVSTEKMPNKSGDP
jgi:hypothetical protein